MKKIISLSVILLLMCTSCFYYWDNREPTVILKLSEEDMAVIPYQQGQQFNMINQNNDTLLWIVTNDTIYSKQGYRYKRHVEMNTIDNNYTIAMELSANKQLSLQYSRVDSQRIYYQYYLDFNNLSPRTLVLDNDTLYNVYIYPQNHYDFAIYYSFDKGIIRLQNDTNYLQLIK